MPWVLFWQIIGLMLTAAILISVLHYDFLQDRLKQEVQRHELTRKGEL